MNQLTPEELRKLLSTRTLARCLHVTRRRVQQLAQEQNVGQRVGNVLVFTFKEMLDLVLRRKPGRPRKMEMRDG